MGNPSQPGKTLEADPSGSEKTFGAEPIQPEGTLGAKPSGPGETLATKFWRKIVLDEGGRYSLWVIALTDFIAQILWPILKSLRPHLGFILQFFWRFVL